MTFLDNLQSHRGGLIKLRTQLCWNGDRGWDNNPGRICLLLDAEAASLANGAEAAITVTTAAVAAGGAALLLIDGKPQWVWLAEKDIDLLVNDPPTN